MCDLLRSVTYFKMTGVKEKFRYYGILSGLLITNFAIYLIYTLNYKSTLNLQYTSVFSKPDFMQYHTDSFVMLNPIGNILDRVVAVNRRLEILRTNVVVSRGTKLWNAPMVTGLNVISEEEKRKTFVGDLQAYPGTMCLALLRGPDTQSNLFIDRFYRWVASEPLCTWIETPYSLPHDYNNVYRNQCTNNHSRLIRPQSSKKQLNDILFYLHILQDVFINTFGVVARGNTKIVPYSCHPDRTSILPNSSVVADAPLYDEVFIISQFWGKGYFHRLVEVMPRMAPFVTFLQKHPEVRVHAPSSDAVYSTMFRILGLSPSRIVTGEIRAKISYLPKGSPCGKGGIVETQIFSAAMHNYTLNNLSPGKRNKIILIQRSQMRKLSIYSEVWKLVSSEARERGLEFIEWRDNPVLPFEDGMRLFYEAVMVVAPHGAGEANLIFSQPGTYVIEIVCDRKFINMCYQHLSDSLGLRYHAIPGRGGCETIINSTIADIEPVIKLYMDQLKLTFNSTLDLH